MNEPPILFRSHTALLLSTALPFLQPAFRHPVELAMKFLEFSETLKLYQEFHLRAGISPEDSLPKPEPGIFGFLSTFILDVEGLLQSLSQVCTGDEKEIIGLFLSLIRAKRFYETYGDLLNGLMQGDGLEGMLGGVGGDLLSSLSLLNPDLFSSQSTGNSTVQDAGQTIPEEDAKHRTNDTSNKPEAETSEIDNSSFSSSYIDSLTSLLNDEQKETLDLLKTLFTSDTEQPDPYQT